MSLQVLFFLLLTTAFAPPKAAICPRNSRSSQRRSGASCYQPSISALAARENDDDEDILTFDVEEGPVILRGSGDDGIDGSIFEDAMTGQPRKCQVSP